MVEKLSAGVRTRPLHARTFVLHCRVTDVLSKFFRYIEGIEILYGTNHFKFSSAILFHDHLKRPLWRPEHFALITSAEILIELGQVARPPADGRDFSHDTRFAFWYQLLSALDSIPEALPNLRSMRVVPSGRYYPIQMARNDICKLTEAVLFDTFDEMVRVYSETNPRLEEIYLTISPAMFASRFAGYHTATKNDPSHYRQECTRLWRPLGSKDGEFLSKTEGQGYWINCPQPGRKCWLTWPHELADEGQ